MVTKLDSATVIIDGSGSKDFRMQLQTYLKRRINEPGQRYIKILKVQDSGLSEEQPRPAC